MVGWWLHVWVCMYVLHFLTTSWSSFRVFALVVWGYWREQEYWNGCYLSPNIEDNVNKKVYRYLVLVFIYLLLVCGNYGVMPTVCVFLWKFNWICLHLGSERKSKICGLEGDLKSARKQIINWLVFFFFLQSNESYGLVTIDILVFKISPT